MRTIYPVLPLFHPSVLYVHGHCRIFWWVIIIIIIAMWIIPIIGSWSFLRTPASSGRKDISGFLSFTPELITRPVWDGGMCCEVSRSGEGKLGGWWSCSTLYHHNQRGQRGGVSGEYTYMYTYNPSRIKIRGEQTTHIHIRANISPLSYLPFLYELSIPIGKAIKRIPTYIESLSNAFECPSRHINGLVGIRALTGREIRAHPTSKWDKNEK